MIFYLIFIGLIIFSNNQQVDCITCMDKDGKNVDWFVLLKPPPQLTSNFVQMTNWIPSKDSFNPLNRGSGYYYKSKDGEKEYENPKSFSYVQYNDISPETDDSAPVRPLSKYAISKGTLVWDDKSAVYFIHSTPYFLPTFGLKKYGFPSRLLARARGHNFMCLTLPLSYVNAVLDHLVNAQPKVYSVNLVTESSVLNQNELNRIEESVKLLTGKLDTRSTDYNTLNQNGPKMESKVKGIFSKQKELFITINTLQNDKLTINSKSKNSKTNFFAKKISPKIFKLKSIASKTKSFLKKAKSLIFKDCPKLMKLADLLGIKINARKQVYNSDIIYFGAHENLKNSLCLGAGKNCYCVDDFKQSNLDFNQGAISVCIFDKGLHDAFEEIINGQEDCKA